MESAGANKSKYIKDFESLFVPIRLDKLRDKARNGSLKHCQFRSLCWRYFLHCLPKQYDQWLDSCAKSRQNYEQIKASHLDAKQVDDEQGNPTQPKDAKLAPLSSSKVKDLEDEQQFIKATNQCDHKNVFRVIERDVVRTFPDMEFFRLTEMQGKLENVLYNFARENPHLSYKQGMHELLATLLYVLHTDSQNCLINYEGGYANDTIACLLDLKYLEHDVFHLFSALMKSIETWYQNDEILIVPEVSSSKRKNGDTTINRASKQQVSSVLGNKLKMISEEIVKIYDLELFNHLEALQIAPQIYGIRWMRLLFGREFEFLDLLIIWDAIICDEVPMSLTDFIFASMLITIRDELVNGDYTDCLNNLMRHQFKDIQHVIKLALHLRAPQSYPRPISTKNYQPIHNRRYSLKVNIPQNDNRDIRNIFSMTSKTLSIDKKRVNTRSGSILDAANIKISGDSQQPSVQTNKFLPAINKFVSSIGQDKASQPQFASTSRMQQQSSSYGAQTSGHPLILRAPVKEYEMRDMRRVSSIQRTSKSYDDLHSIVDYCWQLLSEQIDSLQRCLPKEKSLHSEDEIFVALAQLKKVRDVLKGSLKLEDELDIPPKI